MKNFLKLFSILSLLFVVVNCDDNSDVKFIAPGDSFAITSPNSGASVILDGTNNENVAITIVWEDNYTEATSYSVEMSTDEEFTSSVLLGTSSNNTLSMTADELNAVLIANDIPAFEETTLYFRVMAGTQMTEVINLVLSPYPENNPVITSPDSTFEVVLSDITESETAMAVTWDDPDFSEDTSVIIDYYVEFVQAGTDFSGGSLVSYQTSERTLDLTHGQLNDSALSLGLAIDTAAGLDIRVRSIIETASGDLERISDLVTVTVTPYETALPPILYVVGGGVEGTGWGWTNPVEFPLQGAVYSANINLTTVSDGAFRFFLQQDWNPDSYNYTWFEVRGYTIDPNLVNANDNDNNFQFIGMDGIYNLRIDTDSKTITLDDPVTGPSVSTWGIVGNAYNNWGAFDDAKFYSTDAPNVYVSYVTLVDGFIKFRENNTWGGDLGDANLDGILDTDPGNDIPVNAGTYKVTLNLNDNSYNIEEYFWGIVGSGYNNWGNPDPDTGIITPDAKFTYDYVTNTFKVGVKLMDGLIKFRFNGQWTTNFGGSGLEGTLVDGGDNIAVTAGYYEITLDFENSYYSIVPANIYGVVGSGYNNWGADGPDFLFTPLSNGVWIAEIVPLMDGDIKFRVNEAWDSDFGGSGGVLQAGGANIPVPAAGNYRIMFDTVNLTYELNQVN